MFQFDPPCGVRPLPSPWLFLFRAMNVLAIAVVWGVVLRHGVEDLDDVLTGVLPALLITLGLGLILWSARRNPPGKIAVTLALIAAVPAMVVAGRLLMEVIEGGAAPLAILLIAAAISYLAVALRIYLLLDRGAPRRRVLLIPVTLAFLWLADTIMVSVFSHREGSPNESSAVGALRSINTAQVSYQSTYPEAGFTCDLSALGPPPPSQPPGPKAAGLLDEVVACKTPPCDKSGYRFSLLQCSGTPRNTYRSLAVPVELGRTGHRAFCSDQSGVIRFTADGSGEHCLRSGTPLQ